MVGGVKIFVAGGLTSSLAVTICGKRWMFEVLITANTSSLQFKVRMPAHKRPLKYSPCVISSRDLVEASTTAYCEMTQIVLYAQHSVRLDGAKPRYMKHRHPTITMGDRAMCRSAAPKSSWTLGVLEIY